MKYFKKKKKDAVDTKSPLTKEQNEQPKVEEQVVSPTYHPPIPVVNTPRIAKFHKVSYNTFLASFLPSWINGEKFRRGLGDSDPFEYTEEDYNAVAHSIYDAIELPYRTTTDSAGYDFVFPYGLSTIAPGQSLVIPTGIKVEIASGWCMFIHPRSSLGLNYRLQLDDTIAVIDGDYFNNSTNEGHIMIKITNDSKTDNNAISLGLGDRFCQGVFIPYGLTVDDRVTNLRTGGMGSTNKTQ